MHRSPLYVGDSRDVVNRILDTHCTGNVEGSALRLAVAEMLGYPIARTRRSSGTTKIRIAVPAPGEAELTISAFVRSGLWQYIVCSEYPEAHDFQWYAIENLRPILNKKHRGWIASNALRYSQLLDSLLAGSPTRASDLDRSRSGPGVYLLSLEAE
jgi:hypothetical protein